MSIDEDMKQAPSVTEGDRALALFTDRVEFVRLFAQGLNQEPPQKQILFFIGMGASVGSVGGIIDCSRGDRRRRAIELNQFTVFRY